VAHAAFAQVAQPGLARVLHRVLTPSLRLPWHPTPQLPNRTKHDVCRVLEVQHWLVALWCVTCQSRSGLTNYNSRVRRVVMLCVLCVCCVCVVCCVLCVCVCVACLTPATTIARAGSLWARSWSRRRS
jgi:hypothetical protein